MSIAAYPRRDTIAPQLLDLSVPNPKPSANLSLPLYEGCEYSPEQRAWQIGKGGGFLNFNLELPMAQNIRLTLLQASTALGGSTDNPCTISVNDYSLVRAFDDHEHVFHHVSFVITAQWLQPGHNRVRIQLDSAARSGLSVKSVEIAGF